MCYLFWFRNNVALELVASLENDLLIGQIIICEIVQSVNIHIYIINHFLEWMNLGKKWYN